MGSPAADRRKAGAPQQSSLSMAVRSRGRGSGARPRRVPVERSDASVVEGEEESSDENVGGVALGSRTPTTTTAWPAAAGRGARRGNRPRQRAVRLALLSLRFPPSPRGAWRAGAALPACPSSPRWILPPPLETRNFACAMHVLCAMQTNIWVSHFTFRCWSQS